MSISVSFVLLQVFVIAVTVHSEYNFMRTQLQDEPCVTVHNGNSVNGTCSTLPNCPSVLSNVINRIHNHTVCGYERAIQIICCPNDGTQLPKKLQINVECMVANTNEMGVTKFWSECPELNENGTAADHTNRLCDYEICADLVCCPINVNKNRLKNVCSKVDDPIDTLQLRLQRNLECTIQELNMTGRYQQACGYAERNPHLAPLLKNVCNEYTCEFWYCCPIEEVEHFQCTAINIDRTIATFVGPKCIDSRSERKGTCKTKWDCGKAIVNVYTSTLDKCGSHCCEDYFCCPDDDELDNLSISDKACLSYNKYLSKEVIEVPMDSYINKTVCTPPPAGAAGGILTIPGDYPHMAALGYESDQEILWNCGGSLISDRYVLTAAHCISNRIGPVKKVRLGVVDLLNDINTADCPEQYDVANQITHPEYTTLLSYNDIGLIELDGRVKFNFHIRPLCLPTSSDLPKHFESMGWGATGSMTDEKSVKLLKVYQTLFSHEECEDLFHRFPSRKINRGILNETQICAGSRFSIQSTCKGDSGGPLLKRNPINYKTFVIYGIVSFGPACGFANSPGIYTKVYPYVKWIEEIVWKN